jgi:cupin 2 domain-containing protein
MEPGNLFESVPELAMGEEFKELLRCRNVMVERIASAPGTQSELFRQEQDEWVVLLRGTARMTVEDKEVKLVAGDSLFIPSNTRHQVLDTSSDPSCIWLAVYIFADNKVNNDAK